MIVVLFALALAMLVSGGVSILQGIPFIRLEMGWTMVIAGSVAMSGGAVLLGIAAAVWRLRRIERELAQARETAAGQAMLIPPELSSRLVPPADLGTQRREPSLIVPVQAPPGEGPTSERLDLFPAVEAIPAERAMPAAAAVPTAEERAVLAAADIAPGHFAEEPPPAPPAAAPDAETVVSEPPNSEGPHHGDPYAPLFEPPKDEAPHHEARDAEPVADSEPASETPEAEEPAPDPAPAGPSPRVVAGTYASGPNTYVMYSDGSIEAETPGGHYTFKSLEELKAFAAGEGADPALGRDVA